MPYQEGRRYDEYRYSFWVNVDSYLNGCSNWYNDPCINGDIYVFYQFNAAHVYSSKAYTGLDSFPLLAVPFLFLQDH